MICWKVKYKLLEGKVRSAPESSVNHRSKGQLFHGGIWQVSLLQAEDKACTAGSYHGSHGG